MRNAMKNFLSLLKSEFAAAFSRALNFWLPVFSIYCGLFSLIFVLLFTSEIWEAVFMGATFHWMVVLSSIPFAIFFAFGSSRLWRLWRARMTKR
jgi:hypothetical protein